MYRDGDIQAYMIQQIHQISTGGKKKGRVPRPERKPVTKKPITTVKLGMAARIRVGDNVIRKTTNNFHWSNMFGQKDSQEEVT